MNPSPKILVYGYGNPGRQDDGLGNRLVETLEEWVATREYENIQFDSNYQLNIEDAEAIKNFDLVIFADASIEKLDEEVAITELLGTNELSFTSHAASPGYIVHLCSSLFGSKPESFLVHIKGYEWEFREGLSDKGEKNLQKAVEMVKSLIIDRYKKSKTKNSNLKTQNHYKV